MRKLREEIEAWKAFKKEQDPSWEEAPLGDFSEMDAIIEKLESNKGNSQTNTHQFPRHYPASPITAHLISQDDSSPYHSPTIPSYTHTDQLTDIPTEQEMNTKKWCCKEKEDCLGGESCFNWKPNEEAQKIVDLHTVSTSNTQPLRCIGQVALGN